MRIRRVRSWLLASVGLAAAGVVGAVWLLAPSILRGRVEQEAARRGFVASPGRVRLHWYSVSVEDVGIQLLNVNGIEAHFAEIRIPLDGRLRPTQVRASGGQLSVHDTGTLQSDLEAWRASRTSGGGATQSKLLIEVELAGVDVAAGDRHLTASGVRVRREGDETGIDIATFRGNAGQATVAGTGGHLALEGSPTTFREAHLATAEIGWVSTVKEIDPSSVPGAAPSEPPPPEVLPPVRGKHHPAKPPPEPPAAPVALLPDLHHVRADVGTAIALNAPRIPEGSTVKIDALSFRFQRGGEQLSLGSGPFSIERDERKISLTFSTSAAVRSTPLAVHAELPLGADDVELSVSGGPVPLSLLGIHDGGLLHLVDVDRATVGGRGRVVLDATGQNLTFDGECSVHGLSLSESKLARDPVRGLDFSLRARGLIDDKGELRLDEADGSLGAAHATVHGGLVQTPEYLSAAFDVDVPTASCQALLSSIPAALLPTVSAARMDGTFGLHGHMALDSRNLDKLVLDYDVGDRCRLIDVPSDLDKSRFATSFTHQVYSPTGEAGEETTGPGTSNWSDLEEISPYMQVAVLTTEDGAFYRHHGFSHGAIRNALVANLKARRFVRGASTITMQLAKNLFLSREKTLARKVEELILADYLEQAFSKSEMMELYLNIIEFGPNIYGITAAAQHYFGRPPAELNLAECLFLSSILPQPIAFHKVYERGQLSDGWMKTIRTRMEIAARTGEIGPAELAEGLTETIVFHHPDDPPPVPRQVVNTRVRTDGQDWQELN